MRLLAVRGRNIASLAEPFALDLAAEPLASAGLFAIVGRTGAGKSSILDALCIALYGACPRHEVGDGGEEVPDGPGRMLRAGDPRNCVSRGAVEAFAEADFVGVDGVAYRARWAVRRARGKVDGALQKVERSVTDLDRGVVVANQVTEAGAVVVDRTRLTFAEFCRTVLLPQGQFDALLAAGAKDRAALLEKITGTGHYRDISIAAHRHAADAAARVRDLETRRAATGLLADEDRAALDAERGALDAAETADTHRRAAVDEALRRHRAVAEARERLAAALAAENAATEAVRALDDARADLARLAAAEPLRAPRERRDAAAAAVARAETRRVEAAGRLDAAAAAAADAAGATKTAADALTAAEERARGFEPDWAEAARLDAALAAAVDEAAKAEEAAGVAATERDRLAAEAGHLERTRADAEGDLATAAAALAATAALEPLAARRDDVLALLADRRGACAEAETSHAAAREARIAERAAAEELDRAADADRADREAHARALADVERLANDLALRDEPAVRDRHEAAVELFRQIRDLARAARAHAAARAERDAAARRAEAAAVAIAAAERAAKAAEGERAAAGAAEKALAGPYERAAAAASAEAAHLRRVLVPGEACPVCGATDHPVLADDRVAGLLAGLEADVAAARGRRERADRAIVDAGRDAARGRAEAEAAATAFGAADGAVAAALAEWRDGVEAARRLGAAAAVALDWPEAPSGPVAETARGVVEDAGRRLRAELDAVATLKSAREAAVAARDRAAEALAARAEIRERLAADRARHATAAALADGEAAAAERRAAAAQARLAPRLAELGVAADRCDEAVDDAVRAAADRRAAAVAAHAAATLAVAAAGPAARDARTRATLAATAAAGTARTLADRRHAVAALREARAPLLGGEATAAHRARVAGELDALRQTAAAAAKAESDAAAALAAARADGDGADRGLAEARGALADAGTAFAAALARLGFDEAGAAELLAVPAETVAARRAAVSAADDRLREAAAVVAERRTDLSAAEAALPPDTAVEALDAERLALDEAARQRRTRLGAIAAALASDDAARARVADLETELGAARADAAVWAAVSAAIGSADGSAFVKVAQDVTLGVLIELANGHLAYLKPRYVLTRGVGDLAIAVIDRDMGDDTRSVRSLSGGERFLVSLALALALSGLGGRETFADTLFIDEGFGSLDAASLEMAMDALEALQGQGRTVGVISHVEGMTERIPVQVRVEAQGGGRSRVRVVAPPGWAGA